MVKKSVYRLESVLKHFDRLSVTHIWGQSELVEDLFTPPLSGLLTDKRFIPFAVVRALTVTPHGGSAKSKTLPGGNYFTTILFSLTA